MKTLALSIVVALGLVTVLWRLSREAEPVAPPRREVKVGGSPATPVVVAPRPRSASSPPAPQPELTGSERAGGSPEGEVAVERDRLQARFTGERADPRWASVARQDLIADLGRFGGNDVRLEGIECRASLCRAELVVASAAAASAFLETWLRQRTWDGPGFAAPDQTRDGVPRLLVFLGKPGLDLARAD